MAEDDLLPQMQTRYEASMVLGGVGDALGYKGGSWEFMFDGSRIHEELKQLGGLSKLHIKLKGWPVSDDTVLNLATAESLIKKSKTDDESLFAEIATTYKWVAVRDMAGRAPGATTLGSCSQLRPDRPDGYRVPFNERGGGCGAAMRAMSIGLRYPSIYDEVCLQKLIKIGIETGRMTHHHPTGYLGSLASALFTALAVKDVPVRKWGSVLMGLLPKALAYVKESGHFVKENVSSWDYFKTSWETYLDLRGITDGESDPKFPDAYGVKQRDEFYKSISFRGWGGSSGHDAPIIAYEALLASGGDWKKLCHHGMLHSGDSDSTGVIAGACFGAMYGFQAVPKCNYEAIEYHDRLQDAGRQLFILASNDNYI